MKPLTERQKQILGYMISNSRTIYPTVREIAAHFKLAVSTTHRHIEALRRKEALPFSKGAGK